MSWCWKTQSICLSFLKEEGRCVQVSAVKHVSAYKHIRANTCVREFGNASMCRLDRQGMVAARAHASGKHRTRRLGGCVIGLSSSCVFVLPHSHVFSCSVFSVALAVHVSVVLYFVVFCVFCVFRFSCVFVFVFLGVVVGCVLVFLRVCVCMSCGPVCLCVFVYLLFFVP